MGRIAVTGRMQGPLRSVLTAGIYALSAWLSLHADIVGLNFTPYWPPAAFAVVCIRAWGWAGVIGVLLGSGFLNTVITPNPPVLMVLFALGAAVSAGLAARLLVWTGFDAALGRVRDALALLLSATATTLAGISGPLSLKLLSSEARPWLHDIQVWSIGDALGYLVCAPACFAAHRLRVRRLPWWETVALTAATIGSAALAFWVLQPAPGLLGPAVFLVFPPLLGRRCAWAGPAQRGRCCW